MVTPWYRLAPAARSARCLEPFRRLVASDGPRPWVMLGHLAIDDFDPSRPALPALIGLLRRTLGDDGLLVTDDAAMAPYRADLAGHAVSTLKGDADLILACWNPDVALEVLAKLVRALPGDAALAAALKVSDARLASQAPRTRSVGPD